MKSLLKYLAVLIASILFLSCSDDEKKDKCLSCLGEDTGEELCEGLTDPDSGQKVTLADLEAAKLLLESLGAECIIE